MKALLIKGGSLKFSLDHPEPPLVQGEAIIRPTLVGICKTDLELARGYMDFQGIPGHEFVGVVENCEERSWIGKKVVGEINCSPESTPLADPRHQRGRSVLGILNRDGVMAEKFSLPLANLLEVPVNVPDRQAVFVEPLAAALQISEQIQEKPSRALVIGDGKLGALCVLALVEMGCPTTWLGKHPEKLSKLAHLCSTTLSGQPEIDFPLVVEASGSELGLQTALAWVQAQGTIILKTTVAAPHCLDLSPIVINEIKVIGSRCGRFAPALRSLQQERINPEFLIEKTYPLDDILVAFDHAAQKGAQKILIDFAAR